MTPRLALFAAPLAIVITFAGCDDKGSPSPATRSSSSSTKPPASTATGAATASTKETATASAAASTTPAPSASTGGKCSFPGSWAGNWPAGPYPFSGTPVEFVINADGTGVSRSARTANRDSEFAWALEGDHFSLHGTKQSAQGGRYSCQRDDVGKYTLTFTADCATMSLKLESDQCKGRGIQLNTLTAKRK